MTKKLSPDEGAFYDALTIPCAEHDFDDYDLSANQAVCTKCGVRIALTNTHREELGARQQKWLDLKAYDDFIAYLQKNHAFDYDFAKKHCSVKPVYGGNSWRRTGTALEVNFGYGRDNSRQYPQSKTGAYNFEKAAAFFVERISASLSKAEADKRHAEKADLCRAALKRLCRKYHLNNGDGPVRYDYQTNTLRFVESVSEEVADDLLAVMKKHDLLSE